MLKKYSESDFYELKDVSEDRLNPAGIAAFFIASFAVSAIFTAVCVSGSYKNKNITNPIWHKIINVMLILLIIQAIITFLYWGTKKSFKHQRFQAVWLNIISIKISIDAYPFYFLACEDKHAPSYMFDIGWLFLLGGFVYLILSTIRGVVRVRRGMFRKGGRYLYDFSNSKLHFSIPLIYGIVLIVGNISRNLSASSDENTPIFGLIIILVFIVLVQYGIAMAWPEFFLLAYCKFRFKSFTEEIPKAWLKELKDEHINEDLRYWCNKPIAVLKSITGWKVKEKAPFTALIAIYLEASMIIFVVLMLGGIRKIIIGEIAIYKLIELIIDAVEVSFSLGLFIIVPMLILFKLINVIFKGRRIKK
ncbi:hypothetical protein [Clostridium hydrogenum]|uniref:hypothetical protein n=1 Tax=Clostridium hydrogenum TaxID=2855764 RepID=UPI001F239EDF|nr:hypothetical protein [Clostridium hydrogenum]